MKEVYVSLPNTERVQDFTKTINPLAGDFELVSGGYILDAQSIMGIFTFDLSKPILLRIYNPSEENLKALKQYIVEDDNNAEKGANNE